ncbi:MAG: preprotein translocase subunit SecG [SAR324 cluster bacterium]|uniref:Protein-export membrane protein SecG n=1 Tax=SAR324 cluster bacterium TaxID=2024889 RepID=A0A7X9FTG3_9DELT|nr:preprotein translocase subunit SecG [SAR324 cluster bacterium]
MFQIILGIHIVLCLIIVALVLLQEGKDIGAAFGAGGSNTLFGAAGIDKPIVRATTIVAILFMITSIVLVNQYAKMGQGVSTKGAPLPEELQRVNQAIQVEQEAKKAEKEAIDSQALKVVPPPPVEAPAAKPVEAGGEAKSAPVSEAPKEGKGMAAKE